MTKIQAVPLASPQRLRADMCSLRAYKDRPGFLRRSSHQMLSVTEARQKARYKDGKGVM